MKKNFTFCILLLCNLLFGCEQKQNKQAQNLQRFIPIDADYYFEYPDNELVEEREPKYLTGVSIRSTNLSDLQILELYKDIHSIDFEKEIPYFNEYKKDNYHIDCNRFLEIIKNAEESCLLNNKKNINELDSIGGERNNVYYEKFKYNNKIIGEELIYSNDGVILNYILKFPMEGYMAEIEIRAYTYYRTGGIFNFCPELCETRNVITKEGEEYSILVLKEEVTGEQLYKLIFETPEEKLPENVFLFKKTIESLRKTIYIPYYEKNYYKNILVKAGFDKKVDFEILGVLNVNSKEYQESCIHTDDEYDINSYPQYVYLMTTEQKKNNKIENNLVVLRDGKYYGRYKDCAYRPIISRLQGYVGTVRIFSSEEVFLDFSRWIEGEPLEDEPPVEIEDNNHKKYVFVKETKKE